MTTVPAQASELSVQDLKARLAHPDSETPLLIDVREDWEIAKCRIGNPLHIPLGQIENRLADIPRDRPLVIYCHHGGRSARAAAFLKAKGFDKVENLTGGVHAWAIAIDPSVATY